MFKDKAKQREKSAYLYILAIFGVIAALLFCEATSIDILIKEINTILLIDGILIPFIPLFFDYLRKSFKYFKGKVEKIAIILELELVGSLICSIIATGFSNIFSTALPFSILKLNYLQLLFVFDLSAALALLISALVSIIIISFKARDYVDLGFLNNVKEFVLDCFTYLPIYVTENIQTPDSLVNFLKSPIHYYDKTALQSNISSILNYDRDIPKNLRNKINTVVDTFLEKFPNLADDILKKYSASYDLIYKVSQKELRHNKIDEKQIMLLIRGLFNLILGYDKIFYPNIYAQIVNNERLNKIYMKIQRNLSNYEEVTTYKNTVEEIKVFKIEITKAFNDLIVDEL
ncbi:hypothetical protein M1278_03160 [Candidatus Marsarchaeota archaeon]|nr:hypothetical protein [Candidatus Marsarchaeota archaeon]